MKFTLSLAQMNICQGNCSVNLAHAADLVKLAAQQKSNVVLFPELWLSGFDYPNNHVLSKATPEALILLKELSQKFGIIIGGSVFEEIDGQIYNSYNLIFPDRDADKYQKIHLFRLMEEDRWIAAGQHLQFSSFPWGDAGLAVCYDLRFPEIFRNYALHNAKAVFLVSGWPIQRISHWKTLLRARAIENQLFMIAVNHVGKSGDTVFGGSSAIISPWGETIVEGNETDEQLLTAEIDLDEVENIRRRIPIFMDRRPDIYGDN